MIRDPFYRSILSRLASDLDPQTFEACVADLLRTEWPTLVPVPGGSDFGVDGAVGDAAGPTFPLVATTGTNVLGNLKRSLKAYVAAGGKRRVALLATSQKLTPLRRKNLERAAGKATFTLLQVYSREAIANLLYRSPRWCQDLLGLTGDPAALSLFPTTDRPLVGETLVGRDDDLQWLLQGERDLLLVGQPGSGKTFLMYVAARRGGGLFVVSNDLTRVAADLREKSPRFLIVDDAHLRPSLVRDLLRLRDESHGTFSILVNSWPGEQDAVQRALGGDANSTRQLELLTRDQIVEVLKITGISGPRGLVHELVNQSDGRPGLAVTLCRLWLRGEVEPLATADALFRDVNHTFRPLVGEQATTILAVFAVGGDSGMRLDVVADYLSISRSELHAAVARLAAGGVLTDIAAERLSVRPAALRHALVRDAFFSGGRSLSVEPLLDAVPNIDDTALTVMGARARGARVPDTLLHQLLEASRSSDIWSAFVRLGAAEARWALGERPDLLGSIGDAALEVWPEGVLPLLLNAAVGDGRSLGQHPGHPLRVISTWVGGGVPGTGQGIARRRELSDAVLSWLSAGRDVEVATQAAPSVLSPGFEEVASNPGSARSITVSWGLLSASELIAIQALWPPLFRALSEREPRTWSPLFDLIQNWLSPIRGPLSIPADLRDSMTTFALQMARDVAAAAAHRPGVLHMLRKILSRTEHDLQVEIDAEFETLYPVREVGTNWHAEEAAQAEAARGLASRWTAETPNLVAQRLVDFEREAALAGITWPRWSVMVCAQVAAATDQPLVWAEALRERGVGGDLLHPFLKRLADLGGEQANGFVRACLDTPELRRAAVAAVLEADHPLPELLELSLSRLDSMADWVEAWAVRGEVKESVIERLLRHPDPLISGAAAGGLWYKERSEAATRPGWRGAIVASASERDYNLEEVFKAHPDIALDWLTARMRENADVFWRRSQLVETAISVLSVEQRRTVLGEVSVEVWTHDLIASIVANDEDLYRVLLQDARLRNYHLSPLHAHPDEQWVSKAILAAAAGYTPEQIAHAALGGISGYSGREAAMWGEWVDRFEWLKRQPDESMQAVGRLGSELATGNREKALVRERAAAVHGFD